MGIYLKILAFAALVIGVSALSPSERACAQPAGGGGTIAEQTCDSDVWKTMASRARIETEREIMQNQNLIFKPDSVLAYTCFDSMAAHAGAQAGVLFTHTNYWNPKPIEWGDNGKYVGMDVAVKKVVIDAMNTYYNSNFSHEMLGGRGRELGLERHKVTAQPSSSSQYGCSEMGKVWTQAKCLNFLHTTTFAESDGFYPFINLKGDEGIEGYEGKNEVRNYPTKCGGTPITGSTWLLQYRQSRNETAFGSVDKEYDFGSPLNKAFEDVRKLIEPGQCGTAIKTGVKVILSPGATQTYDDGVCTNPGCTYTNAGTCSSSSARQGGPD